MVWPKTVGTYMVTSLLGHGNYGEVRLGQHVRTMKKYAVKILRHDIMDLDGYSCDVRREMSILMALQHPNIIRLHDVHLRKSKLYLIMELATNGDLFTHIYKRGPLPPYIARNYFIQLLDAVNHCHENGIYHRDLKPENILLTQDCNVVKLADFGFAAMIDKYHPVHKLLRTNCGSPHYCAPEVWNGETYGYDGGKADAFSCGVILYVMLSGGQPFNDSSEDLVLSKVNECIVEYPERIAEDARELISGLLRRNPHTRFSTREARKHRWLDDAGTLPTTTETLDNYYVPYLQTCP